MEQKEVLKLVRNIAQKWDIETSERELYKIINGKELPKEVKKKPEPVEKSTAFGVMVDSKCRDSKGEPIYFPKVGSHYDRALQKTFHSKKEKADYMKKNNLIMDGSSDLKRRPIEAGDERFARVR